MTLLNFKIRSIKKIAINFSFRSFLNILSRLFGLITFPIVARAFGPELYGNYSIVLLITQYAILPVGLLGLRTYGIRELSQGNEIKKEVIVNGIISEQFIASVIIYIVVSFLILYIFIDSILMTTATLIALMALFNYALNLEFYFIAIKDLVFPTISIFVGQMLFVLGIIFFVTNKSDFITVVILYTLSTLIPNIIMYLKYIKKYKIKIVWSIKNIWSRFKKTYKIGISVNIESLLTSIPIFILSIIGSSYLLGQYYASFKILSVFIPIYITLFYSLAPYLVKISHFDMNQKYKIILLMLILIILFNTIICGLLFVFGGELLVYLIGPEFSESKQLFESLTILVMTIYPVYMFFGNVLIFFSNEKFYMYSLLIAVLVAIIATPILVDTYQAFGAVLSLSISLIIATIFSIIFLVYSEKVRIPQQVSNE
ncbi:MAG: oligosaccharide flippase family protein [Melioribacteraceae bacterium]|nr:oligosaccharide flippase family protein [Melioribacteraceae bacterium]